VSAVLSSVSSAKALATAEASAKEGVEPKLDSLLKCPASTAREAATESGIARRLTQIRKRIILHLRSSA